MELRHAIVLDTEVIRRDPLLQGTVFSRLWAQLRQAPDTEVIVSKVVLAELSNGHRKSLSEAVGKIQTASSALQRLCPLFQVAKRALPSVDEMVLYYEARLRQEFVHLAVTLTDLPWVSHQEVLDRAIARRHPFDKNGRGYQDTLIWLSVVELAKTGKFKRIAFVSGNTSDFSDGNGALDNNLRDDVKDSSCEVTYFEDLTSAIDNFFDVRLPSAIRELTESELRDGLSEHEADVWASVNEALADESYDGTHYELSRLGDSIAIDKVDGWQIDAAHSIYRLSVRFSKAEITKLVMQTGRDRFTDHTAPFSCRMEIIVDSNTRRATKIDLLDAEFGFLGRPKNARTEDVK